VPFVGAAAMLEPEHATVGAAPMPAAPKKSHVATNYFQVVDGVASMLIVDLRFAMSKLSLDLWFASPPH